MVNNKLRLTFRFKGTTTEEYQETEKRSSHLDQVHLSDFLQVKFSSNDLPFHSKNITKANNPCFLDF